MRHTEQACFFVLSEPSFLTDRNVMPAIFVGYRFLFFYGRPLAFSQRIVLANRAVHNGGKLLRIELCRISAFSVSDRHLKIVRKRNLNFPVLTGSVFLDKHVGKVVRITVILSVCRHRKQRRLLVNPAHCVIRNSDSCPSRFIVLALIALRISVVHFLYKVLARKNDRFPVFSEPYFVILCHHKFKAGFPRIALNVRHSRALLDPVVEHVVRVSGILSVKRHTHKRAVFVRLNDCFVRDFCRQPFSCLSFFLSVRHLFNLRFFFCSSEHSADYAVKYSRMCFKNPTSFLVVGSLDHDAARPLFVYGRVPAVLHVVLHGICQKVIDSFLSVLLNKPLLKALFQVHPVEILSDCRLNILFTLSVNSRIIKCGFFKRFYLRLLFLFAVTAILLNTVSEFRI